MNGEIHPISAFVIANYEPIRLFFTSCPFMIPAMFILLVIYLTQRIFSHGTNYYRLMMKCYMGP
jgi:hypothetical protein